VPKPSTIHHPPYTPAAPGIRDAEGVARAWGLKIYDNRKQRLAQLASVKTVMERADFPKSTKTKGGAFYDRAAVTQYGLSHIVMDGKGRGFEWREKVEDSKDKIQGARKPDSKLKLETSNLPPAETPAADEDLFAGMSPTEMRKGRFDRLQDMYLRPEAYETKISQWEKEELKEERPWIFAREPKETNASGGNFPTNCTLGQLGDLYKKRWPEYNINVYKAKINHWQTGNGLPVNAPFHPMPADAAGRYNVADCFAWFEKWQLPKYKKARTPELPGVPESEEAIDLIALKEREEREQIAFNRWERDRERGEYVHKTTALATGIAAVKRLHQMVKTEDERNLPKQRRDHLTLLLNGKGVALEIISAVAQEFEAWDIERGREITDRRELMMQVDGTKG
jgi:hypothetical protein